jgi:hypothetical protein
VDSDREKSSNMAPSFSAAIRRLVVKGQVMSLLIRQVFPLDVDGKPTLAFEARNTQEARELCKELCRKPI